MRKLFLMLGATASGKDTFLKERGLTSYSVSSDDLRRIVGNPEMLILDDEKLEAIDSQKNDNQVWDLLYEIVEKRMSRGETTFVNATHLFPKAFRRYGILARIYHYKIIIIDATADLYEQLGSPKALISELTERAIKRNEKFANPAAIVEKYVSRYLHFVRDVRAHLPYEVITISDFDARYVHQELAPADFNEFERLKIIGDVHGDFTNLQKVFDDHYKGTAYIFVGDYLDRGTKNAETFKFLQKLRGRNIFFLRGNHEKHIENFALFGKKTGKDFGSKTLPELMRAGVTVEDLKDFVKKLTDSLYFTFDGQEFFVSHAGIENVRFDSFVQKKLNYILANETEFTMGLSTTNTGPYDRDIDALWQGFAYNIHGHRNNFHKSIENGKSFNLTEEGEFRYIELTKNKAITVFAKKSIDMPSFVETLVDDEDVTQKIAETNENFSPIISHNFTREVFEKGRWTPTTMDARGLFTRDDAIIGRGVKKFFNINENSKATLDKLTYPVRLYEKFNGFLVITFWDKATNRLKIFNKSGVENNWHTLEISRKVIIEQYGKRLRDFYENPKNHDYSVLFEVMAPELGDEHIVDYTHDFAAPIAVLSNKTGKFNSKLETEFDISPLETVINETELQKFLDRYNQQANIEGLVLRDSHDFQLKYKTDYYQIGKILRTSFQNRKFQANKYQSQEVNQVAKKLYQNLENKKQSSFSPKEYYKLWKEING